MDDLGLEDDIFGDVEDILEGAFQRSSSTTGEVDRDPEAQTQQGAAEAALQNPPPAPQDNCDLDNGVGGWDQSPGDFDEDLDDDLHYLQVESTPTAESASVEELYLQKGRFDSDKALTSLSGSPEEKEQGRNYDEDQTAGDDEDAVAVAPSSPVEDVEVPPIIVDDGETGSAHHLHVADRDVLLATSQHLNVEEQEQPYLAEDRFQETNGDEGHLQGEVVEDAKIGLSTSPTGEEDPPASGGGIFSENTTGVVEEKSEEQDVAEEEDQEAPDEVVAQSEEQEKVVMKYQDQARDEVLVGRAQSSSDEMNIEQHHMPEIPSSEEAKASSSSSEPKASHRPVPEPIGSPTTTSDTDQAAPGGKESEPRAQTSSTTGLLVKKPSEQDTPSDSTLSFVSSGDSMYHRFYEEDANFMRSMRNELRREALTVEEVFGENKTPEQRVYREAVKNAVLSSSGARGDFTGNLSAAIREASDYNTSFSGSRTGSPSRSKATSSSSSEVDAASASGTGTANPSNGNGKSTTSSSSASTSSSTTEADPGGRGGALSSGGSSSSSSSSISTSDQNQQEDPVSTTSSGTFRKSTLLGGGSSSGASSSAAPLVAGGAIGGGYLTSPRILRYYNRLREAAAAQQHFLDGPSGGLPGAGVSVEAERILVQTLQEGRREPATFIQQLATARDHLGQTLLHLASDFESPAAFKLIAWLAKEVTVPVDALDFQTQRTALLRALGKKFVRTVKVLLDCGASGSKRDSQGVTPAIYAAREGVRDVLWVLMHRDEHCIYQTDARGSNCLHWACARGHISIVRYLADFKANFEHQDEEGNTPLLRAVLAEELGIAQFLIERGLNAVARDRTNAGEDAFMLARERCSPIFNKQFVEMHDHIRAEAHEKGLEDEVDSSSALDDSQNLHQDDEDEDEMFHKMEHTDLEAGMVKSSTKNKHKNAGGNAGGTSGGSSVSSARLCSRLTSGKPCTITARIGRKCFAPVSSVLVPPPVRVGFRAVWLWMKKVLRQPKKRALLFQRLRARYFRRWAKCLVTWMPVALLASFAGIHSWSRHTVLEEEMTEWSTVHSNPGGEDVDHVKIASSSSTNNKEELDAVSAAKTTTEDAAAAAAKQEEGEAADGALHAETSTITGTAGEPSTSTFPNAGHDSFGTRILRTGLRGSEACFLIAFVLLLLRDPGFIPKSTDGRQALLRHFAELDSTKLMCEDQRVVKQVRNFRYCEHCHVEKPVGAKHCRMTNRCIADFDQHCIWIRNSIGRNNHRLFLFFLLAAFFRSMLGMCGFLQASRYEFQYVLEQRALDKRSMKKKGRATSSEKKQAAASTAVKTSTTTVEGDDKEKENMDGGDQPVKEPTPEAVEEPTETASRVFRPSRIRRSFFNRVVGHPPDRTFIGDFFYLMSLMFFVALNGLALLCSGTVLRQQIRSIGNGGQDRSGGAFSSGGLGGGDLRGGESNILGSSPSRKRNWLAFLSGNRSGAGGGGGLMTGRKPERKIIV